MENYIGEAKQHKIAETMSTLKSLESEFKQQKSAANLAAQQGDFVEANNIINNLRKIIKA